MTDEIGEEPVAYEVENFSTATELRRAVDPWDARWQDMPGEWVFRGQSDAEWGLVPSALRATTEFRYGTKQVLRPQEKDGDQKFHEGQVIRLFLHQLNQQGLPVPTEGSWRWMDFATLLSDLQPSSMPGRWPPEEMAPLFALAQHHGVPTRLLDWSRRPLVACYFAAVEAAANRSAGMPTVERLAVWALSLTRARMVIQGGLRPDTAARPLLEHVEPPLSSNPNLRAQRGLFTLLLDEGRGSAQRASYPSLDRLISRRLRDVERQRHGDPLAAASGLLPLLRKMTLPTSEAGPLLRQLAGDFVSATHLFPGLDGAVRGLRERALWDRVFGV